MGDVSTLANCGEPTDDDLLHRLISNAVVMPFKTYDG